MAKDNPNHYGPGHPKWGHYGDLRPSQIEKIRSATPVAYVPWGALEWHCNHDPIGLDSAKARGICAELARETGGVVLPPIPMGVNTIKPYKGFGHTIDFSADLASRVAEELCLQLADESFKLVILFTGHYPPEQIDALEAGAERARKQLKDTQIVVWADNLLMGDAFKADHAGATETSFQMLFEPGSVDFSGLPEGSLTLDQHGVTGDDPREASAERGQRQLDVVLKNGVPQVRDWLRNMGY